MGLLPSVSLLSLFILSPLLTTTTTAVTAQAPPPVFKWRHSVPTASPPPPHPPTKSPKIRRSGSPSLAAAPVAQASPTTSPRQWRLLGIDGVPANPDPCSSSDVQTSSPADSLLAANGTYIYTANNCSKCTCDAANDYKLQCQPSGLKPANGSTCTGTEAAPPPGKNGAWKVEQVSWSWAIVLVSIQLCRFL
ncbi:hypothetical protein Cgig2_019413 [Carnegiea gigantea]|uniref:Uncharacterized protein n=1 Tax=Carnegiea gigantea TaxID=171969 RepID=A0A9Q1QMN2_9CARY|nr:hypothetical protein Cgig2_019413 [Carnegiea gigantea]